MRRTFNLNIAARAERHAFAFRDGQLQLFNESRFVIIRDNFTLPFFDAKNLFRQRDLHVLLHGNLAGQTAALFRLAFGDMGKFGRQDISAPLLDRHPALAAGTAASAGRRDKDPVAGQRIQQLIARRRANLFIRFIIDFNNHITGVDQLRARRQD